jgi:hypothetical protein
VRKEITEHEEMLAIDSILLKLDEQLRKKGRGTFASIHEISGVLDEEVREFKDEIHSNNHADIVKELEDIAVTCLWGIASIESKKIDW